jgi:DNA-binding MarR family transcriptional regulator
MADASPFKHAKADDSAGFLLWKLTALWQAKLGGVFTDFGITQTQYAILASLRWFEEHREPTTQALIAKHARIEPMTLSKAFRKLQALGLVVRKQSAVDSRAISIRLTPKGRTLTQKAVVAVEDADEEFFGRLSEGQLRIYKSLAVALIDGNDPTVGGFQTMRSCWIGVVSRSHVELGVNGGFIQLNHGKKTPVQRLKAGDGVIMYSPRTAYPDGESLQAFTAIGTVVTGDVYQVEMTPGFQPFRVDVQFVPCAETPIKPLLKHLSFVRSQTHWGAAFRFGFLRVHAADFAVIANRMGATRLAEQALSTAAEPRVKQRSALAAAQSNVNS